MFIIEINPLYQLRTAGNIHKCRQCAQSFLSCLITAADSHVLIGSWYSGGFSYKIDLLTYKSLLTNQSPYLRNLLHIYFNRHTVFQPVGIFYVFFPALLISVNVLSAFSRSYCYCYWHHPVVRPSVCDAVHCGSQGRCTETP